VYSHKNNPPQSTSMQQHGLLCDNPQIRHNAAEHKTCVYFQFLHLPGGWAEIKQNLNNTHHGTDGSVKAPMTSRRQVGRSIFLDYDVHSNILILHQFLVALAKGPPLARKLLYVFEWS
jgi:hypothetical protein